jgi:hypothetical protein
MIKSIKTEKDFCINANLVKEMPDISGWIMEAEKNIG